MSYQARMRMPPFSVTGRTGACGNTKRTDSGAGSCSAGTIGTKSLPSAPRPCSQITAAFAGSAGSTMIEASLLWIWGFMRGETGAWAGRAIVGSGPSTRQALLNFRRFRLEFPP